MTEIGGAPHLGSDLSRVNALSSGSVKMRSMASTIETLMQNSRVSRLPFAPRPAAPPAGARWWSPLRERIGRWLAGRVPARASAATAADPPNVADAWPDTAPASRTAEPIGVDGAPAMVFTDSMPPYSTGLDRPWSAIDSAESAPWRLPT